MAPRISNKAMAAAVPQGIESEIKPATMVDGQLAPADGDESDEWISQAGKKVIEDLARGAPEREIPAQDCGTATPSQGGTGPQPTLTSQQGVDMDGVPVIPIVIPVKGERPVVMEVREAGERVPKWQPKAAKGAQKISRFKANRMT
jgi:hypothetical protein